MWEPLDLGELVTKLRSNADLSDDERDYLAELIEKFGGRPRSRKEQTELKASGVASWVVIKETVGGLKTEAAVAEAAKKFGLKRARVFEILKPWRPKLEDLKQVLQSHTSNLKNKGRKRT